MRPVSQTKFGKNGGNCILACVASLLHRRIEDIPDFNLSGCGWFGELYEWCLNEDIGLILLSPLEFGRTVLANAHCIMIHTVPGIADENHATIGWCERSGPPNAESLDREQWEWTVKQVFDPNPKGVPVGELLHLIFLIR